MEGEVQMVYIYVWPHYHALCPLQWYPTSALVPALIPHFFIKLCCFLLNYIPYAFESS